MFRVMLEHRFINSENILKINWVYYAAYCWSGQYLFLSAVYVCVSKCKVNNYCGLINNFTL